MQRLEGAADASTPGAAIVPEVRHNSEGRRLAGAWLAREDCRVDEDRRGKAQYKTTIKNPANLSACTLALQQDSYRVSGMLFSGPLLVLRRTPNSAVPTGLAVTLEQQLPGVPGVGSRIIKGKWKVCSAKVTWVPERRDAKS